MLKSFTYRPTKSQIGRFLFSLLLAVLLWTWVTERQDPFTSDGFSNIPIQTSNLSDDLQIITTLPTVEVRIEGAKSDIDPIISSDIVVSLDTSSIKGPGEYLVPVKVADIDGTTSRKVIPSELQIVVEQRLSKVFPLEVVTQDPVEGDSRRIGTVAPEVSQVTVNGPSSVVDRVAKVQLPVSLSQQTADFTGSFIPIAVDASGQPIKEVTILPGTVSATVPVVTRGKYVSVVPKIVGVPEEGYSIQARDAVPQTILVDGPQAELDKLLFVDSEPVDVSGATESISRRVGIANLPEGLRVLEPSGGTVEIRVAIEDIAEQDTQFTSIAVDSINLGDGLTAEISPSTVTVSIDAPRSVLQEMTADDVKVRIDLTGKGPGSYEIQPDVTLPQRAASLGIAPNVVTVVIHATGDLATPASSPAASPESEPPTADLPRIATPPD
jgi:YbbR domain-containing protein